MAGVPKSLLNLITSNKYLPEYLLLSTIVTGTVLSTRDYGTNKKRVLYGWSGAGLVYIDNKHINTLQGMIS